MEFKFIDGEVFIGENDVTEVYKKAKAVNPSWVINPESLLCISEAFNTCDFTNHKFATAYGQETPESFVENYFYEYEFAGTYETKEELLHAVANQLDDFIVNEYGIIADSY